MSNDYDQDRQRKTEAELAVAIDMRDFWRDKYEQALADLCKLRQQARDEANALAHIADLLQRY